MPPSPRGLKALFSKKPAAPSPLTAIKPKRPNPALAGRKAMMRDLGASVKAMSPADQQKVLSQWDKPAAKPVPRAKQPGASAELIKVESEIKGLKRQMGFDPTPTEISRMAALESRAAKLRGMK